MPMIFRVSQRQYNYLHLPRSLVLFLIVIGAFNLSHSQINVKIGYVPAYGSFSDINSLLDQYNLENANNIEAPFNSLKFIHGIDVGFRYKVGSVGFEFDWINMNRERDALLFFPNSDSFDTRLYKFTLNSFSFNINSYFNKVGFGAGIYSQKLNINREIASNKLALVSENSYALDLHLNFRVQSSNIVSFVIKPYYRLPLGSYNLEPFANDLLDQAYALGDGKMAFLGMSIIFYNGKQ